MIGIGATLFKRAVMGSRGFSPSALFANGEEGAWYDPSDLSTLFQSSNGTTAVAVGDPVGYIEDKSGNGNHAIQATSAKRPTLRESGGLYYLEFNGAQGLTTSSIDFTATDTMTSCLGLKKDNSDTASLIETSNNVFGSGNSGVFRLLSTTAGLYRHQSKGTILSNADGTVAPPATSVLLAQSKISTDFNILRIDGTQLGSGTTNQGTGNFTSQPLNVGARNNGSNLFLTGRIYSLIIRNVLSSSAEIDSTEAYVASKTGVSL